MTNQEVGKDLVELMSHFLKKFPKFQKIPFYVFGSAYGAKTAAEFALQLETVPSSLCKTYVKRNQSKI